MKKAEWIYRCVLPGTLSVILFLFLFGQFRNYQRQNNVEQERLTQIRYEMLELDSKKTELLNKQKKLEESFSEKKRRSYSVIPVFITPDNSVFPQAIDLINQYGWKGMIGLSRNMIPGNDGCVHLSLYNELLKDGWDSCIYWDGDGELSDYLYSMRRELNNKDIEFPKTVLFEKESYSEEYDRLLEDYGIDTFICYTDADNLNLSQRKTDNGLRELACSEWNRRSFERFASAAYSQGGLFCTTCYNSNDETESSLAEIEHFLEYLYKAASTDEKFLINNASDAIRVNENELEGAFISEREIKEYDNQMKEISDEVELIDRKRRELFGMNYPSKDEEVILEDTEDTNNTRDSMFEWD